MGNGEGWHRGDRVVHLPTARRGIVEGWKADKLLVYWGTANKKEFRDWVPEGECQWEMPPKGL